MHGIARRSLWRAVAGWAAPKLAQPNAAGWSVLDVLEHLHLAERRAIGLIGAGLRADPGPLLPEQDLALVLDRSVKREAPDGLRPGGAFHSLAAAREALDESRAELQRVVASVQAPTDLDRRGYPHPAFGLLNLRQWGDLVALHEVRHLMQLQEMLAGG